jgi:oligoribonuclease NrnB/cAMP/cGMP phosphodiesterase (DHH superfamily)
MNICIYHGNCQDGFGGAWVIRKCAFPGMIFHPGKHGDPPPDVTNMNVVMVDFSYKRPILLEMAEAAKSILILDHHKSAQEELVDLPKNVEVKFNMERSGAMMAWDHYFPMKAPPKILLHIEDRDLWKFSLENTREIAANLFSYPYNFDVWDMLMEKEDLVSDGVAIERKHHKDIEEILSVATKHLEIDGHIVPVVNVPYTMGSDAAAKLAVGWPFAAYYWDSPTGREFGLRSAPDGLDVSVIARKFGGGGHKHAAGFKLT